MPFRVKGISKEQYGTVVQLKGLKVLKKTRRAAQKDEGEPVVEVTVMCGDGKKIIKKMKAQERTCGKIVHPQTVIGGACACHPESPMNSEEPLPLRWLLRQIRIASMAMDNTRNLAAMAHLPCGGAKLEGLSLIQQIELAVLGGDVLIDNLGQEGFQVTVYVHFYYGDDNEFGEQRVEETFEIDRNEWLTNRHLFAEELSRLCVQLSEDAIV